MPGHSRSLRDHTAFPIALIAFACAVIGLLGGVSPARSAGIDGTALQSNHRVAHIEALDHAAVPAVSLESCSVKDPLEEVVELVESTDDDESEYCHLRVQVAAFGIQPGRYKSSAERALAQTPFRLRAFSNRGSPIA